MGNIFDQDIYDIWNGSKYKKLRKQIESKKFNNFCSKCNVVSKNKTFLLNN